MGAANIERILEREIELERLRALQTLRTGRPADYIERVLTKEIELEKLRIRSKELDLEILKARHVPIRVDVPVPKDPPQPEGSSEKKTGEVKP